MSSTLYALLALAAQQALAVTININTAQTYQTIDGFGFSEAFGFVGGLYNLPTAPQNQALDLLFSKTVGAGFNIVRNRIGSDSGNTIEPTSPGSPNATPKYVSIGSDENQLWFSKKAQTYGVTTFYADAWSAPGYMKTTGNEAGGGYLCGVTGKTCSSGDWRQAYANYLVQYLKDYQANGVNVTYVGFLNEPEYAASYSAMLSDGTQAASFINILYPTIQAAGLKTGITCCDAEGWNMQKTFTQQLIAAGVESKLARITSHSYTSKPNGPISTSLRVWQTEYADLDGTGNTNWYSNGNIGEGLTWANNIYQGIVNSNLSAYLHWIGIQSGTTDAALVFITNNAPVPTGRLWAFGQWARYVLPGAVRLGTTGSTSSLLASAFKNPDGTVSVQVINNGDSTQSISITGFSATSVTAYLTNQSNIKIVTTSASVSGGTVTGSSPARSMITFLLQGNGSGSPPPSSTTSQPSTAPSTTTKPPATTTSSSSGAQQTEYGQCGGLGWAGPTTCQSPYTCKVSNPYYSQCL